MSILPLENQNNTQPQNKLFDKLLGGTLGAIYGAKSGNFLDGALGGYIGYKNPNSLYDRIMNKYLPYQTTVRLEQDGGQL
jgi:hypothetical protein